MSAYITHQEVREQAGFQYKERGEALGDGDGSTVVFTVANIPIVDRNYSGTPVTIDDVVLYAGGTPVAVSAVVAGTWEITASSSPASGSPMTADYDWSNLDETTLGNYIREAHGLVLSRLSEVYTLPLSSVPDVIKLIEKKLAAGLLLDKEYSAGGDGTEDTRGRRWVKWAEKKLDEIVSGGIDLLDSDGNILTQKSGVGIEGWPDETTKDATDEDAGGDVKFRGSQDF